MAAIRNDADLLLYYAAYNAKVSIGIDMENITVSLQTRQETQTDSGKGSHPGTEKNILIVTLPEVTITDIAIDPGSLDYIFADHDANDEHVSITALPACKADAEAECKTNRLLYELAQENAIKSIEAEIRRQEEEARKKAAAAGQSYKTISLGDIKFIWPCPSSGRITSGFGGRSSPTAGASSNHQGIDIGAPTGTDIVAAAAGEVVVSTYSYSAGNYVMLSHGGGVYTVYMHASKLLVSAGDSVKQGQVIAKVGSTGYSTGPHLHFGVRVNGTYVNPSQYVSP